MYTSDVQPNLFQPDEPAPSIAAGFAEIVFDRPLDHAYTYGVPANLRDRVGVWSIHRYGDPDASKSAYKLTLERALKVAVHETSHMFSLRHCTAYECVMGGSNSLDESDRRWVRDLLNHSQSQ